MKAIKIHCLATETITIIKSGNNKAWKNLSRLDQSMIQEVVKQGRVVTCGQIIYEPIFKS